MAYAWGVDYGVRRFSMVRHDGEIVEVGLKKPKVHRDWHRADELLELVGLVPPFVRSEDFIYLEAVPVAGARNLQTALALAATFGALTLALRGRCVHVTSVAVATWKKEVIGHGNATKDDVARWAYQSHPTWGRPREVTGVPVSQDGCDASAIAEYGRRDMERRGFVPSD